MKNFILLVACIFTFSSKATHLIAAEMYYNNLGNDDYEFNLIFYRDCGGGAPFDPYIHFTVFDQSNNLVQSVVDSFPGSSEVYPVPFASVYPLPCTMNSADTCVEYTIYSAVIHLPPIVGGYTVSYQRCCLSANILNIINPGGQGYTMTSHIPGSETGESANNSPRFMNHSPFVVCNNQQTIFDHSGNDPDGDSLAYEIAASLSGGSSFNPNPVNAAPPPYLDANWASGYSLLNPLGSGSSISFDTLSGELEIFPIQKGEYAFSLIVKEYRNGTFLSQTRRNLNLKVVDLGLEVEDLSSEDKLNISNPTTGYFVLPKPFMNAQIKIYDLAGKVVYNQTNCSAVDFSFVQPGIYILEVKSDEKSLTQKIQKL